MLFRSLGLKIAELLVREGLDRGSIDNTAVILDSGADDVFGNGGFPRSGGSGDDHRMVLVDEVNGFLLEAVVNHK